MPKINLRGFSRAISRAQNERAKSTDTAIAEKEVEIPWKLNPGPQMQAAESEADEVYYGGSAGGGKGGACYGIQWAIDNLNSFTVEDYPTIMSLIPQEVKDMDSKALMWDGQWKGFSELQVGDRLMNPDGQFQEIIQIHERGQKSFYRVTFEDGAKVECDGDHIWGFWEARTNSRRKSSSGTKEVLDNSKPTNWNTNYIVRARTRDTAWLFDEVNKGRRFIVPINAPLNYTNLHRGIAERAYLYGALIGDGSIQTTRFSSGITFHTADEHIKQRCLALLKEFTVSDDPRKSIPFWNVRIRDKWVDAWARNSGLMGKYSHNKFIPDGYLRESLEFRWNLAQGLFDTDGYASMAEKNEVSYCTVSPQLAEDVASLVRSLGYIAKIRQKQGVCCSKGYEGEKRMAYIVSVEGNDRWRLFSLPRKIEAAKAHEPYIWCGKAITDIEQIGSTYCRCITVSNPNGLYITDGYTVTHNSALLLILAATQHRRSIIFRRVYPNLKGLIENSKKLLQGIGRYNSTDKMWRNIPGDRTLEFGAMEYEDDKEKFRGIEHDLKGYDEVTELTQSQFEFTAGWNRTTIPGQKCRVVCTFNPPSGKKGGWIIKKLAPWLDPRYQGTPALPGELRWFIRDRETNEEVEVPSGEPIEYKGELLTPRSRTFIPARLDDNPYLKDGSYRSMLQSLPEPLRSQLLYGDFKITEDDDIWQVIPTKWVRDAMARWQPRARPMYDAIGVDVSRGGSDESILAPKQGLWIDELKIYPGIEIPDGDTLAYQIIAITSSTNTSIKIDVVGVGSSPYDSLKRLMSASQKIYPLNGGEKSVTEDDELVTDRTGVLAFANRRSEWWWNLRELLDPANGFEIELPDDDTLLADLTTPLWKPVAISDPESPVKAKVQVESKDEIKKRLKGGRSPDRGDAVVYAFANVEQEENPLSWMLG